MPETTGTYKPLVLVDTENLPEDEWLEWRRRGIGGSDAAAILSGRNVVSVKALSQ